MRSIKCAKFFLSVAAVLLLLLGGEAYQEKITAHAAAKRRGVVQRPERAMAMTTAQNSEANGSATRMVIERFNEAFNRHDADALAAVLSDDTVFEDTSPAPDGKRIEGKAVVVEFWRGWFARNAGAKFEAEDVIVSGDRAVVLWVYRKTRNGQPWHLRGVDVFTVRDGKVAAKLAYVKG